jgi:hypothetical protein
MMQKIIHKDNHKRKHELTSITGKNQSFSVNKKSRNKNAHNNLVMVKMTMVIWEFHIIEG